MTHAGVQGTQGSALPGLGWHRVTPCHRVMRAHLTTRVRALVDRHQGMVVGQVAGRGVPPEVVPLVGVVPHTATEHRRHAGGDGVRRSGEGDGGGLDGGVSREPGAEEPLAVPRPVVEAVGRGVDAEPAARRAAPAGPHRKVVEGGALGAVGEDGVAGGVREHHHLRHRRERRTRREQLGEAGVIGDGQRPSLPRRQRLEGGLARGDGVGVDVGRGPCHK